MLIGKLVLFVPATTTLVKVSVPLPVFVTVRYPGVLFLPTYSVPMYIDVLDNETAGVPPEDNPVPVKAIVCVPTESESTIWPLHAPTAVGLK